VISIALIEDNRLVREGITALLSQLPDLKVVAGTSSADTAMFRESKPQVVLLDLGLQNGDSLRLAVQVKQDFPESKVIVMDLLPVHEDIMDFVNAGVSGFIMKDATVDDLVSTIRSVAGGAHVLPPQMTSSLFSQIAKDAIAKGRPEVLDSVRMTPREREVLREVVKGRLNKQIAFELGISEITVKLHRGNVTKKMQATTVGQLIRIWELLPVKIREERSP